MLKIEIDTSISNQAKKQFTKVKDFSFRIIESEMSGKGYKIPKSRMETVEFDPRPPKHKHKLRMSDLTINSPVSVYEKLEKIPASEQLNAKIANE